MEMHKEQVLELNLQENGLDFILKGIDELFDDSLYLRDYVAASDLSTYNFKYGILHLFSGFLLLLKEGISRDHPNLIFEGELIEILRKHNKGEVANTKNFTDLVVALQIGSKFSFVDSEMKVIRRIQQYRNTFEHYKASFNRNELWNNVQKFLSIIDKFLTEELSINIESSEEGKRLQNKIAQIESV